VPGLVGSCADGQRIGFDLYYPRYNSYFFSPQSAMNGVHNTA
jgi:hypothetical protein